MKSIILLAVSLVSVVVLATTPFSQAFPFPFPNPNSVGFYLYPNPLNPADYDELIYDRVESVKRSRYDPNKKLIMYASGLLQNRTTDSIIVDAYLAAGATAQANIIIVDWGKLSGNGVTIPPTDTAAFIQALYAKIKLNTPTVGRRTAEFIQFLQKNRLLPRGPESVHLIGQSMGAHVMGVAGHKYQELNFFLKKLGRITGTEPAGPLYQDDQGFRKSLRLDPSDARFVDIVHTDEGGNGYLGNCGTVDFVVNGGKAIQPACIHSTDFFCSHNTAVFYFALSIYTPILAQSESDPSILIPFGEYCPLTARGVYDSSISLPFFFP